MAGFATAAVPSAEKLRGGYYTPAPIARFLANWVSGAGPRLLEPSCGDGSILSELTSSRRDASVLGVELDAREAEKATRAVPGAEVVLEDLFAWFSAAEIGAWDGVAGNPPFIRYQHWTEGTRENAFMLMRSVGLRPTRLTNAWVPFTVASALTLREGGRLGLVLPAELLQVGYAAELRAFLVDSFSELTVVAFRELLFEKVLQEVVLLLGVCGSGPAAIRVVELANAESLPTPASRVTAVEHAPALLHDREKWTRYFLPLEEIEALREAKGLHSVKHLGDFADVDVGIVTGRNEFFVMKPSQVEAASLGLYCAPLVSKSAHLRGVRFEASDLQDLEEQDARCRLLTVDDTVALSHHQALRSYVSDGEAAEIHLGYKCSIRRNWWVVPSIWTPDAFMLRQIYDHPRIIANEGRATSTDTIHRVRITSDVDASVLAAASVNSLTFAFSEVLGRSYGGGVLELEPREAEHLPFPSPEPLTAADVARVNAAVRDGRLLDALDHIDSVLLVGQCGLDQELVTHLRNIWIRLRDRRLARGRSTRSCEKARSVLAA